ncbi:purple acid phosphatase family protein [Persicitalea jodogahamensis]|uniref:Phosphoesterase n=1 Tax=Persicitalea jodogahamensis TaxID=402147 RepID=A0A8J3G9E4_9BACT|nr:metallophosphoesterase family protein [Persicitalea jodogahamensis]GHB62665.1 phosphoesterase [Persicitalea jodogahamensis]
MNNFTAKRLPNLSYRALTLLFLTLFHTTRTFAQSPSPRAAALAERLALDAKIDQRLLFPTATPDRVIMNVTETPETSVAVNWRTDPTQSQGEVQWAVATDGPEFLKSVQKILATTEFLSIQNGEVTIEANYHAARLAGLEPAQSYVYRVGFGDHWSEWHQFRMPAKGKALSFLYFGDAQNDVKSLWSRVVREAYKKMPQVDFMLHAGDLINRSSEDIEWGEWFYAGSFIHSTVPSLMTPGNHEYAKGVILAPQWKKQFNLPANGPAGLDETCYQINYQDLKVISLDAEQIDESPRFAAQQAAWLDSILTNDPRPWTVVTLHYPFYSTKPNRDNAKLRDQFKPIIDKHRVDLVLQGHDHAYGRGSVANAPISASSRKSSSATVYVVSVSGPKMYDVSDDPWMDRRASNTQLFQLISLEGKQLIYQAFTATGELYDSFLLEKGKDSINKLTNKIPAKAERAD